MTNPQEIKFVSCPLNLAFWGSTRTKHWKCYESTAFTLAGTYRDDSVNALRMIQDKEVSVQVRTNGKGSTQEFTESELEAAIIMYCIKRGIPMARHAIKSLEVAHETLFLHLRIGP